MFGNDKSKFVFKKIEIFFNEGKLFINHEESGDGEVNLNAMLDYSREIRNDLLGHNFAITGCWLSNINVAIGLHWWLGNTETWELTIQG